MLGVRFGVKMLFLQHNHSQSDDRLIFMMEICKPWKMVFILKQDPDLYYTPPLLVLITEMEMLLLRRNLAAQEVVILTISNDIFPKLNNSNPIHVVHPFGWVEL